LVADPLRLLGVMNLLFGTRPPRYMLAQSSPSVTSQSGSIGMALRRSDMEDAPPFEPPLSDTERRLAQIWQESIGIDSIGRHDDFFLVCGSSLVAAVIFAKVQKQFGVKLPLSLLVSAPSVAQLALHIDERRA
jgi:acyl carrier protein